MSGDDWLAQVDMHEVTDTGELAEVKGLEQGVFRACGFADVTDYDRYDPQSTFFGAFDTDGSCVGMLRLVHARPQPCPAFSYLLLDEPQRWFGLADDALVDEVATAAVHPTHRGGQLFVNLVRLAYRNARARNVTHFVIIIEPERAERMNSRFDVSFVRIGPDQTFRGETQITAPFMLDLEQQLGLLEESQPTFLTWLRHAPFDHTDDSPLAAQREDARRAR